MISFEMLDKISDKFNEEGNSSHSYIDELYKNNELNNYFNDELVNQLKEDITNYLDLLFCKCQYHYNKKMKMEKLTYGSLNWIAYYMLAVYAGNEYSYRNVPSILYLLIEKLNIAKYKNISYDELFTKVLETFDIKDWCDPNREQYECEIIHKSPSDKYDKYDKVYDFERTHATQTEEFSVWAEHRTFDIEVDELKKYNMDTNVIWAARYYGDGYGFDVLSVDLATNKEKLIEVKSGKYNSFSLTENEVNVMRNCHLKNADYYIHKYTCDLENHTITTTIYKYDYELDLLVDQDSNYYNLSEYPDYDERGQLIYKYTITKNNKQKTII